MRKLLIQFIFSFSLVLPFSAFAQQSNDGRFKYNSSQFRTYGRGTLFEEIERNADTIKLGVYSSKVVSGSGRQMVSKIDVSSSEWDSDLFQLPESIQVKEDGMIFIKHRIKDEFFPIFSSSGDPVCRVGSATSTSSTAEEWIEEVSGAVEKSNNEEESSLPINIDEALQKKSQIYEQMLEDYAWFENKRSELIRNLGGPAFLGKIESADSNAQQSLAISILEAFAKNENFIKDPERAERIFVALTLYGEFGTVPAYRNLANLYWAHQTIKNRESSNAWRNQEINSRYDPQNIAQNIFGQSRMSVVLAPAQYSTWNLGDQQLSVILMNKMGPITRDIFDFVAADDAGLIQTSGKPSPRITHYISPVGLTAPRIPRRAWYSKEADYDSAVQDYKNRMKRNLESNTKRGRAALSDRAFEEMILEKDYPSWWFEPSFNVYSSVDYPEIVRLDQKGRSGLESASNGEYQTDVDPAIFAGAKERR